MKRRYKFKLDSEKCYNIKRKDGIHLLPGIGYGKKFILNPTGTGKSNFDHIFEFFKNNNLPLDKLNSYICYLIENKITVPTMEDWNNFEIINSK